MPWMDWTPTVTAELLTIGVGVCTRGIEVWSAHGGRFSLKRAALYLREMSSGYCAILMSQFLQGMRVALI